jgi:hypothetical protein
MKKRENEQTSSLWLDARLRAISNRGCGRLEIDVSALFAAEKRFLIATNLSGG